MKKLLGIVVLCMLCTMTACGTEQTSSSKQMNEVSAKSNIPESTNQLIAQYQHLELQELLDASLQKNVFKKDGFPQGYELSINQGVKEAVLLIRPVSEKNYPDLESSLEKSMREALDGNEYSEYTVKINPLWNTTNQTSRQFHEEKLLNDVVNELQQLHQIEVLPGIYFSETDGRVVQILLTFLANGEKISDPVQINQYGKEFFRLAEEKGLKLGEVAVNFLSDGKKEWTSKVIPAINKGLNNMKELQVMSVIALNEHSPIFINTSLNRTDESVNQMGEQIETVVTEFLQYSPVKESFPAKVEIQVLSADQQKIN